MFRSPVGEVSNLAGVECPINSKLYYITGIIASFETNFNA